MSHRPIRLLVSLAAAALLVPAAALGNGGDDLTTAPEMPTTVRQFSAKFGADYWKVFLNVGDLMTIDYSSTDGDKVSSCRLPPTVTGSTPPGLTPGTTTGTTTSLTQTTPATTPILTDDQCAGSDTTFTRNRITLSVVNPPGYWTLVFADGL